MNAKVLPFIGLAGLVLLTAVIWNLFGENEQTNKVQYEEKKVTESIKPKPVSSEHIIAEKIVIEDYDNLATTNIADLPIEERKEIREKAANYMQLSMQYPTSQQALAALKAYKNKENDEMVKTLLSYIRKTFPETAIPKELVD